MSVGLTSSEGIIALLDRGHPEIIQTALTQLDHTVNHYWHEIAYHINKLEVIYGNASLPNDTRCNAALLISKVYFHLGEYSKCADFAILAGSKFSLQNDSEYAHNVTNNLIDRYIRLRENGAFETEIDPCLHNLINQIVDNSIAKGHHKIVIGFSLDTQRFDLLLRALGASKDIKELLSYSIRLCTDIVANRQLRNQVLEIIVTQKPATYDLFQCFILLEYSERAATEICRMYNSKDEDVVLLAYQSVFDIYQDAPQSFICKLIASLSQSTSEVDISPLLSILNGKVPTAYHLMFLTKENKTDPEILRDSMIFATREPVLVTALGVSNAFMNAGTTSEVFLRKQRVKLTKRCQNWAKYTAVASLGVIHRGNESVAEQVLAEHFPDLGKPNKPNGGGDEGVEENPKNPEEINEAGDADEEDDDESDDEDVLYQLGDNYSDSELDIDEEEESYDLFTPDNNGFIEGGALYALGLIHANRSSLSVINTFLEKINSPTNSAVCRGACLGLGLVAMGLGDEYPLVISALQNKLNEDDAIIGESAAISLGLVSLGTFNENRISEMIEYSILTEHEKIQRGIAVGLSLICFGHKEKANATIKQLVKYKDNALLRRAGVMSLGMAYCGTSNSQATKKLLKIGVTDNDYDVRRAAVISIGFVMAGNPEESLNTLRMLGDSYNPHTRYAVAMALGISCAGSGHFEALNYLKTLVKDKEGFVIQGALIASSIILVQQTQKMNHYLQQFNKIYEDVIRNRFTDEMAKFGAILAQGIVNAGGRNVNISLQSRTGQLWTQGTVGIFLFTQYWYWFPMSLTLVLSFVPTCVIGVDKNLKIPQLEIVSNCTSSLFSYPLPITKSEGKIIRKRVEDVMLSFTVREIVKKLKDLNETVGEILQEIKKDKKEKSKTDSDSIAKDTPFTYLKNLSRVLKPQLKYLSWKPNDRYHLAIPEALRRGGFLLLKDNRPNMEVLEVPQLYKEDSEVAENLEIDADEDEANAEDEEANLEDEEDNAEDEEDNAEDEEDNAEEEEDNAEDEQDNAEDEEDNAEDEDDIAEDEEDIAEDEEDIAEDEEDIAEDEEDNAEEEENIEEDEEDIAEDEDDIAEDEEDIADDDEDIFAEDEEHIFEEDEEEHIFEEDEEDIAEEEEDNAEDEEDIVEDEEDIAEDEEDIAEDEEDNEDWEDDEYCQ